MNCLCDLSYNMRSVCRRDEMWPWVGALLAGGACLFEGSACQLGHPGRFMQVHTCICVPRHEWLELYLLSYT